jgi:hypothetical protein
MELKLGEIVATPGALEALERNDKTCDDFLFRHEGGDWGEQSKHDRKVNEKALKNEGRIMSTYPLGGTEKIWIITEWDRSVTTILLPEEY